MRTQHRVDKSSKMSSYIVYEHKTSFNGIKRAFHKRKDLERRDGSRMMNDSLSPRPIGPGAAVVVREQPPAAYSGNPFLRNVVVPQVAFVDNRDPFPSPIMLVENKELEPLLVKILKCVEATGAHIDPTAPTNAECNPWKRAFHRLYCGNGMQNNYRRPNYSDRCGGFKTSVLDVWRLLKTRPKHPCWERSTRLHRCYKAAEEMERLGAVRELEKLRTLRGKASEETKSSIKNKRKGPTKKNVSIQSKQNLSKGALSTKMKPIEKRRPEKLTKTVKHLKSSIKNKKKEPTKKNISIQSKQSLSRGVLSTKMKTIEKLRPEKVTKTVKHKPKTIGYKQPKTVPCVVLSVPLADKLKTETDTPCVVVSLHLQEPPPSPVPSAPKPSAPQPFVPYRNPGAVAAWTNSQDENDGYGSDGSTDSLVF